MAMLGRLGRRLDGLGLFVGIAGVLGAAYTLTGRPPDVFLMRGLGLRSIAVAAASEALFLWALWAARRRVDRASRAGRILTIAGVLVSVGALAVMLRHPLTGAYEFPHRHWEIIATRLALLLSALPFVALWCLPALARAVAATVVPNATRGQALGALVRHGWQRSRGLLANLALSGISILVTLLVIEAALRVMDGSLLSTQNLLVPPNLLASSSVINYDPLLGWVLADNQSPTSDGSFSTGEHGVRMNGREIVPVPHHAILAIGDSFSVGSGVSNWETWPAQLAADLGEPVVNAGMGGWGTDQIILRAESLMTPLEPREIIVAFLAEDILRAGYSTYGSGNKPYFTTENGTLKSHGIPVPRFTGSGSEVGWMRQLLGYSHLAVYVIRALGRYEQWSGSVYRRVDTDVVDVTCLLLERLRREADAKRIPVYLAMLYGGDAVAKLDGEPPYAQRVVACAQKAGIVATDTWQTLRALHQRDATALEPLYNMNERPGLYGHPAPAGNALIARLVADAIKAYRAETTHKPR